MHLYLMTGRHVHGMMMSCYVVINLLHAVKLSGDNGASGVHDNCVMSAN